MNLLTYLDAQVKCVGFFFSITLVVKADDGSAWVEITTQLEH